MSHLICCERVTGGRVFFFPEALGGFIEGEKDGKSTLAVLLHGNNTVQIKEDPTSLVAKIMQALGNKNFLTIYEAHPEILAVMNPIGPLKKDEAA